MVKNIAQVFHIILVDRGLLLGSCDNLTASTGGAGATPHKHLSCFLPAYNECWGVDGQTPQRYWKRFWITKGCSRTHLGAALVTHMGDYCRVSTWFIVGSSLLVGYDVRLLTPPIMTRE